MLLSQHPRAGRTSPLRAISEAGLLRMILNAARPDLFPSPARTTGGGGATLTDTDGGGDTIADGAGGRDLSEETVAGGEGVSTGCIAAEEETSTVSPRTLSNEEAILQTAVLSDVSAASSGAAAREEDSWPLIYGLHDYH